MRWAATAALFLAFAGCAKLAPPPIATRVAETPMVIEDGDGCRCLADSKGEHSCECPSGADCKTDSLGEYACQE